ncbi:MAG: hypothetical protein V7K64_30755 [Nostoc sp.]|uniref:hypothetical protein n=1 Tax=unclassified Nostoc TaxID=2593658 RepID=UPI0025D21EDE|nr:hypothetical protein [Nostoc sp. JL34]
MSQNKSGIRQDANYIFFSYNSIVSALKACNGNVKFPVYLEANHDWWTQTYNNPELYEWFLQHRR